MCKYSTLLTPPDSFLFKPTTLICLRLRVSFYGRYMHHRWKRLHVSVKPSSVTKLVLHEQSKAQPHASLGSEWTPTHLSMSTSNLMCHCSSSCWSCHDSFYRHGTKSAGVRSMGTWICEGDASVVLYAHPLPFMFIARNFCFFYLEIGHIYLRTLFATLQVRLGVSEWICEGGVGLFGW